MVVVVVEVVIALSRACCLAVLHGFPPLPPEQPPFVPAGAGDPVLGGEVQRDLRGRDDGREEGRLQGREGRRGERRQERVEGKKSKQEQSKKQKEEGLEFHK